MSRTLTTCRPVLHRALSALVLAAVSGAASAHDAAGQHGFLSGFLHPFTGVDHLAAMLAVGLWSTTRQQPVWQLPLAFLLTLLTGAILALAGLALPATEPVIAASLLVLGLLLSTRVHLPNSVALALIGGFALFHGAAHGQELSGGPALLGMLLGTATVQLSGLALGRKARTNAGWLPRATGGLIALSGVGFAWAQLVA
ncbi:MAG TPA: HupE/UreJ family protein [Macromonas sp.]|nr:HupE/UreJ family protein [Macromonas sp.]